MVTTHGAREQMSIKAWVMITVVTAFDLESDDTPENQAKLEAEIKRIISQGDYTLLTVEDPNKVDSCWYL